MSLHVSVLSSIEQTNRNQWNHVVENAPLGSLYHRYEWLQAVESGTEKEPKHLLVEKKGNPVGILPNVVNPVGPVHRLESVMPGFGGPLASTDEKEVIELLLRAVPEICDGTLFFSRFQTLDPGYIRYHEHFRQHGYVLDVNACRFIIDLSVDWETLLKNLSRTRRQNLKRGHDQTYTVTETPLTANTLSSFYVDHTAVMERSEIPALPISFILELENLDDRMRLFSLQVDGEDSGSILCHLNDEQSTIHYAYSGIRSEWFDNYASELLHEHAIKYGLENGYERYDLRRTSPDFRDGLFQFKSQFGGEAVPLLTWERGCPKPARNVLQAGRAVLTRFK